MPDMPEDWADLIQALTIMSRHPTKGGPLHAEHDELFVCADAEKFTPDEIAELEQLGFDVHADGGFHSFT